MADIYPALQVQVPNVDIAASLMRGQEVRAARLGNMLTKFKLDEAKKQQEAQNLLREFYNKNGPGIASGDPAALNELARIDPSAAQTFRKGASDSASSELKTAIERAEFVGRSASMILGSPDHLRPMLYKRAIQQAEAMGIDVRGIPQEYDDTTVKNLMAQALSLKDQLGQKNVEATQQIQRGQLAVSQANAAEARRHNIAVENKPIILPQGSDLVDPMTGTTVDINGRALRTPKLTEDQSKATQLYQRAKQQLPVALENFESMADLLNQGGRALDSNVLKGEQYQRAEGALKDIVATYLYVVSGATANPGEVQNLVATVTPKFGDTTNTLNDKKQRLQQMVDSIALRAGPGVRSIAPSDTQIIDFNSLPE